MNATDAVQAGGVLAFASVVLYILRELRPVLKDVAAQLFEMRITFAALLERERLRDQRRKRESSGPLSAPLFLPKSTAVSVPQGEFDEDPTTDIVALIEKQRAAAGPRRGG